MLPNDLMKQNCFNSTEDSTFFRKCQQAAEKVPASLGFGILTWVLSEFPLERLEKIRVIAESALKTGIHHGGAVLQHVA